MYTFVSPIDAVSPAPGDLVAEANSSVTFQLDHPQPLSHDLVIEWRVNGVLQGTEAAFVLPTGGPGTISVELLVDDPTPLVRNDPAGLLTDRRTWTVTVPAQEPPSLALLLNQTVFHAGETLRLDLQMRNPGPALTVDMYLGALLGDGRTVLWLTNTAPLDGTLGDFQASPATFVPLLRGVTWPAGLDVMQEDYLVHTWGPGTTTDIYHLLVAWTVPNSLADGSIDPGDVVALGWVALTFQPSAVAQKR